MGLRISLLSVFFLTLPVRAFGDCDYSSNKQILKKTKFGYTAEWTIKDGPGLEGPISSKNRNYLVLKRWIAVHTKTTDWTHFIRLHHGVVQRALADANTHDPGLTDYIAELNSDSIEDGLALSGRIGTVHPIHCLESIPYLEYLGIVDLTKYPQEFWAEILKKNGKIKIVGDFYLDRSAIPGEATGVEESPICRAEMKKLMAEGWQLYGDVHDHTFVFDPGSEDEGAELAPSVPDIYTYLDERPQVAIIVNGIDSIEIPLANIVSLKATMKLPDHFQAGEK